ncbi:MAG: fasciclin domain-containing protein [Pyrinomonadaceae bacterium]
MMNLKDLQLKSIARNTLALGLLAIFALAPIAVRADTPKPTTPSADIVDTAVAAGTFKTLAAALGAAELIEALKGAGPFTVFAPTDEAFAKLPTGTVEMLLKPENKEKLKAILLYHVVSGQVLAGQVVKMNGKSVKTLQGSKIKINTKHGVRVNSSNVTQTDIMTTNGVIHVIDTVLMPKM